MTSIYTGKLESIEQPFTFFYETLKVFGEDDPPNTPAGSELFRYSFEEFADLFYDINKTDDNISNFFIWNTRKDLSLTNNNPYKFTKKIIMKIDKISFTTAEVFLPSEYVPFTDVKTFNKYLPLNLIINDEVVTFSAGDGSVITNDQDLIVLNNEITGSNDYRSNTALYQESYKNAEFDISSFPNAIKVALDLNNNIAIQSLKEIANIKNSSDFISNSLNTVFFDMSLANFRIDGRIIQTIDYSTIDDINLNKPQRIIKEDLNLQSLSKLLKSIFKEKEEEKDLLGFLKSQDKEEIIQTVKERLIDTLSSKSYLDILKENIII